MQASAQALGSRRGQTSPLPVNHVGMRMEDMDAAIAWERAVLGLDLIDAPVQFTHADPVAKQPGPRGIKGARVLAGLRSRDGSLSVRVRPSSLKHGCDRRTTSTSGKCLVNVPVKSCLAVTLSAE
jgi:hypothetical protein